MRGILRSCFLASFLLVGCPAASPEEEPTPAPVAVVSVSAEAARFARIVDPVIVTGIIGPKREVTVMAEGSGRVVALPGRLGLPVSKSAVLARLDTGIVDPQLDQALAQADQAAAGLELAQAENSRAIELHEQGASTDRDRDHASIQTRTQQSQLQAAEAAVKLARRAVSDATIRAPFGGELSSVHIELGAVIAPGTPAFGLVDLSEALVSAGISGREVPLVKEGQSVVVRVPSLGERTFEGTVSAVSPSSDPRTRTWAVEVRIPNDDRALRGGMVARVEIVVGEREGVLVPGGAVVESTEGPRVFVLVDKLAEERAVTLGRATGGDIEVRTGVEAGEMVAVLGSQRLSDGAHIDVYEFGGAKTTDVLPVPPE